ncbi:PDZ and LIM domain protein 3 isoform X4 [Dendroctonus ponderosae]|uniref:PDZ domain-containing protein n=1 Tax=Dendroctonus ponderosae TaxID=77166 RepID=A0AAR5PEX0_DENPD|nr:PDZ and LIM domain protein 3 isoform X4 [Dendroctonus ponderosae]
MGKFHEFLVDLRRSSPNHSWGFSLVGGSDVKTPLIVTRVAFGSPAQGVLQRGDIISKVGNYDSRDIRHEDAQNLFRTAGNNIRVVVQRETAPRHNASTGSSRNSSHYSPLSVSPNLSPRGAPLSPLDYSPAGSALTPVYTNPLTPIDNNYFEVYDADPRRRGGDYQNGDIHVSRQIASSVLDRISTGDPNKQLIHKQFNSPINLYSEPNVMDTIHKQTGVHAVQKRSVKFNPAESATYQYLQEEELGGYGGPAQEVTVPPQSKIYTPTKKPANVVNQSNPAYLTAINNDPEIIQQSGSFRRLMMSVLPGSNF